MKFNDFLNKIIESGIEGAGRNYIQPNQKSILRGSVAGFKACRGKNTSELSDLLEKARKDSREHLINHGSSKSKKQLNRHWYLRGFVLEVEWTANVISAVLLSQGLSTIITPTARGMLQANKLFKGEKERSIHD